MADKAGVVDLTAEEEEHEETEEQEEERTKKRRRSSGAHGVDVVEEEHVSAARGRA